ncbi:hypothetical protein V4C53_13635 [Paraburkholderia azotifigens]|uniref:hypothetical protein n=1 Tax=Paraburkholderia azotifigens TaxID=2057004 RepID=UPI00317425BD
MRPNRKDYFMRRGINCLFACGVVALISGTAYASCEKNEQTAHASLPSVNGQVLAQACDDPDDEGGDIYLTFELGAKEKRNAHLKYEIASYVLELDTKIKFENGTAQGVGISTGGGRDGNGMHYWMVRKTGVLIDLGDAPALSINPFEANSFSALVTSSNSPYQSILYFYQVKKDKLIATKAVGFIPKGNVVRSLSVLPDGQFQVLRARRLSQKQYLSCQDAKTRCW